MESELDKLLEQHQLLFVHQYRSTDEFSGPLADARLRRGVEQELRALSNACPEADLDEDNRSRGGPSVLFVLERVRSDDLALIGFVRFVQRDGVTYEQDWWISHCGTIPNFQPVRAASSLLHLTCALISRVEPKAAIHVMSGARSEELVDGLAFSPEPGGASYRFGSFPTLKAFGNTVKRFRQEKGMSQADLALLAGIGPSGVAMVEYGQRMPGPDLQRHMLSLAPTSAAQRRLLLATLTGAPTGQDVGANAALAFGQVTSADLWLIRTEPLDANDQTAFEETAQALRNGNRRIFFHSQRFSPRSVLSLCARFANAVENLQADQLRFVQVPDELACLQLSIAIDAGLVVSASIVASPGVLDSFPIARATDLVAVLTEFLVLERGIGTDDLAGQFSGMSHQSGRRATPAPTFERSKPAGEMKVRVLEGSCLPPASRRIGRTYTPSKPVSPTNPTRVIDPDWLVSEHGDGFVHFTAQRPYGSGQLLVRGQVVFTFSRPLRKGEHVAVPAHVVVENSDAPPLRWTYRAGVEWRTTDNPTSDRP